MTMIFITMPHDRDARKGLLDWPEPSRRDGDTVVLEPVHEWPEGYAESFAGMPSDVRRPAQEKPDKRESIT